MYIKQPSGYKALVTPYHQRLLQFGVDDSKVYLSEAANQVFQSFTNGYTPDEIGTKDYDDRVHAIIDGGNIQVDLDGTSLIRVTLSRSTIIADTTMLVFPEETTVDIDVESLDDSGEILVFLNYKYIQSPLENQPYIKALYYDGVNFIPDEFDYNRDGIVLTRVTFTKEGTVVTNIHSSITDPYLRIEKEFITINGIEYEIAPLAALWYRIIDGMRNIHPRKEKIILDQPSDWIPEVPTFELVGDYYCATIDLNIVDNQTPSVLCYINNIAIVPSAIQCPSPSQVKIFMPQTWAQEDPRNVMEVLIIG